MSKLKDFAPQVDEKVILSYLIINVLWQGFQVLVEREWLEFGHKFADRCGLLDDANERCPVFLQWLDCVHNIAKQFPCAFQFNSNYLVRYNLISSFS